MEKQLILSPTKIPSHQKTTEDFILSLFIKKGPKAKFENQEEIVKALNTTFSEYRQALAKENNEPNISIREQPSISKALKKIMKNTYIIGPKKLQIRKINGFYCNSSDKILEENFEEIICDISPFVTHNTNVVSKNIYAFQLKEDKIRKFVNLLNDRYYTAIYDIFVNNDKVYVIFNESADDITRYKIRELPSVIAYKLKERKELENKIKKKNKPKENKPHTKS